MKKIVSITCEFCGKDYKGESTTVKIEGALMIVCSSCTSYGKEVKPPVETSQFKPATSSKFKSKLKPIKKYPSKFKNRSSPAQKQELFLSENYDRIIRSSRMKKGMSVSELARKTGISEALIQSYEAKKIKPTDLNAGKLERILSVELFEEMDLPQQTSEHKKNKGNTIGDLININRLK